MHKWRSVRTYHIYKAVVIFSPSSAAVSLYYVLLDFVIKTPIDKKAETIQISPQKVSSQNQFQLYQYVASFPVSVLVFSVD